MAGPVARLLDRVEDQRVLAEQEVWSGSLAVSEQRRVEHDREESQVGVGLHARVGLSGGAGLTDGAATVARAHVRDWSADWEGDAHAITTAWVDRAGVELLALGASEASWAVAAELEEWQVRAAAVVHAWCGGAAERSLNVEVATLRVRVVDQVLWAVHDGEFAEAVADDELDVVGRVGEEIAWVGGHA